MAKSREPNRVTVRLDDEERRQLEAFSKKVRRSKSEVMRVALRLGLEQLVEDPKKMLTPPKSWLEVLDAAKEEPPSRRSSRD